MLGPRRLSRPMFTRASQEISSERCQFCPLSLSFRQRLIERLGQDVAVFGDQQLEMQRHQTGLITVRVDKF